MKNYIISLLIAFFFGLLFFYYLITLNNVFNFLPYFIYHGLKIEKISEKEFILIFDFISCIITSFFIFWLLFFILKKKRSIRNNDK